VSDNLFAKIIRGEIPADRVYEDDKALAFRDIDPQAPVHVLVVPKEPIARLAEAEDAHQELLGHLLGVCRKVAVKEGIDDAFRVVVNSGAGAGQSVFHLHLHVLGGRDFAWPPG
jgi:histidine triad (HIT) family protein